jgi:hypothetical protein
MHGALGLQHWYKDMRFSTRVKDGEGMPAFALVNRPTGLAIKHSLGQSYPVMMHAFCSISQILYSRLFDPVTIYLYYSSTHQVAYIHRSLRDNIYSYCTGETRSVQSRGGGRLRAVDVGKGFRCVRMVNNTRLALDAFHGDKDHGGVHDGTAVVLWEWCKGDNQSW